MFAGVEQETERNPTTLPIGGLRSLGKRKQLLIILGKRFGTQESEDRVDEYVKRFLRNSWNARAHVTAAINKINGKSYECGLVLDDEDCIRREDPLIVVVDIKTCGETCISQIMAEQLPWCASVLVACERLIAFK
jgi:hypothetical protein